ncbi:MAG: zinc-binding dehydrogenase, partial [Actinomycetales bacterium]|nr:zinc-binding dehydrogenase [Actinomycetales bacterium]
LAVFGCGGVGLSAIQIAKAIGAKVVAVDVSAAAREAAQALGADVVVDPSGFTQEVLDQTALDLATNYPGDTYVIPADVPTAIADLVVGATYDGAHVGIDALGDPATAAASILSLRRRGRHVQVGLLLGEHARPPLPMDRVVAWELELYGSHGMGAGEYPEMLRRIASGELDPGVLVGRTVSLEEAPAALEALGRPGAGGPGMTVVVP